MLLRYWVLKVGWTRKTTFRSSVLPSQSLAALLVPFNDMRLKHITKLLNCGSTKRPLPLWKLFMRMWPSIFISGEWIKAAPSLQSHSKKWGSVQCSVSLLLEYAEHSCLHWILALHVALHQRHTIHHYFPTCSLKKTDWKKKMKLQYFKLARYNRNQQAEFRYPS